jgi:REP element-mobilizing transposase RayT
MMKDNGHIFGRRSMRLEGYDYSQNNAYFVTICTKNRELSTNTDEIRSIIRQVWDNLPDHYDNIILDEFVIMPNHIHGIIIINNRNDKDIRRGVQLNAHPEPPEGVLSNAPTNDYYSKISPQKNTLSVIIRTYKAAVTTLCRKKGVRGFRWQRNYYEHVIRNDEDLYRTRKYIRENPLKWELDEENPDNLQIKDNCRGANGYVPGHRGAG